MIIHKHIHLALMIAVVHACNGQTTERSNIQDIKNPNIKVGPNIPIVSQFGNFALVEPHISAYPSDNDRLFAAAMVVTDNSRPYESCRLSSFVSTDGGNTWKETAHDWWGYDPWTAVLPNGKAVLSWIGTAGSFQDKYPVVFLNSRDGGANWEKDVQILAGEHDGTKMTAFKNDIFFTSVWFRNHMSADIRLYKSTNGEQFTLQSTVDGKGERLNFCEVAVLSDSTIVVPASLGEKAWVNISSDYGKTLSQPYPVSNKPGEGYAHLVSDNSHSIYRDRLYLVRAAGGIWINYSTDKGKTWSKDIRVDKFENSTRSCARVASIAVNKKGDIGISWVDCQSDKDRKKNDVYFTYSADGGASFQNPVRITSVSSNPKTKLNNEVANLFPGGGHYLGIATRADGSFQLIWSDSRNGVFQLQTCNVITDSNKK
jgi:hypothetical protein